MTRPPDSTERRYLDELLSAMRGPCEAKSFRFAPPADTPAETRIPTRAMLAARSPLVSEKFEKEFRTTLLIHHYFLRAPLATNSFEAAFIRAALAAKLDVLQAPDGQRFWDVEIGGRKISLKSTAAAGLRLRTLHISKLCEAAWIQDTRGATQRERATKRLFKKYIETVDAIIQLRLFKEKAFYEMVEIPTVLLARVGDVPRTEFARDGPSIGIPFGQDPPDFTLKLDRSDAKITLANISKSVCRVLGTWQLDNDA